MVKPSLSKKKKNTRTSILRLIICLLLSISLLSTTFVHALAITQPPSPIVRDIPSPIVKDTVPTAVSKIQRLYGETRFATSIRIARELKKELNVAKFENILVATGWDYADALSGGYLATVKKAPILLVSNKDDTLVLNYIKSNLIPGGTIYILGGSAAVSNETELMLKDISVNVKRLQGKTRYETNLEILKEAEISGTDLLVCSGNNYPDAISAVSTGRPVLLVNKSLTNQQKNYLSKTVPTLKRLYVLGGPIAVGLNVEDQINKYKTTTRIFGNSRYETSCEIAKRFFPTTDEVILATGSNFPDGLTGGVLAAERKAPLLLTDNSPGFIPAFEYIAQKLRIKKATILGGGKVISPDATAITVEGAKKRYILNIGSDLYFAYANGTIAKKKFINHQDKKYYATDSGKLVRDTLFIANGKYYGATKDGSLARNGWFKVGKLSYHFENDYTVTTVCLKARDVIIQEDYDLEDLYYWIGDNFVYYSFNLNPNWGSFWFAGYGLEKHRGGCTVIASVFYLFAKMLNYDAIQVQGYIGSERQQHSWVFITQEGKRWIYDPQYYAQKGRVAFKTTNENTEWYYHSETSTMSDMPK